MRSQQAPVVHRDRAPEESGAFEDTTRQRDVCQPGDGEDRRRDAVFLLGADSECRTSLPLGFVEMAASQREPEAQRMQDRVVPAPVDRCCEITTAIQGGLDIVEPVLHQRKVREEDRVLRLDETEPALGVALRIFEQREGEIAFAVCQRAVRKASSD